MWVENVEPATSQASEPSSISTGTMSQASARRRIVADLSATWCRAFFRRRWSGWVSQDYQAFSARAETALGCFHPK